MRIGINARNLLANKLEGFGQYSLELISRICKNHPEHEFYLFFDRPYDSKYIFSKNVIPIVLFPPTRHPVLYVIWFEFSLKKALKENRIKLFWSPDGFCSLGSNIPQIATIHDINFEHNPQDLPWLVSKYYRFFFPKFVKKAKKLITVSDYSSNDIQSKYGIEKEKITTIYNGANKIYQPIRESEKEKLRLKYTQGNPYFIFVGSLHPRKNVDRLIQAFTHITKTNDEIRLVIVGSAMWKGKKIDLPKKLVDKIIFTGHLEMSELSKLMASAKALTYVPYFEGFGIPLVEAMRCGTPILAANTTSLPEVAKDAAIYCDPFNVNEIAKKMNELLSDETLCLELSQKGLERSKDFSWDKAAELVWLELSRYL